MNAAPTVVPRPSRILLATDLDSHSDRALDRAAQLARDWQATLHVVHVPAAADAVTWLPSKQADVSADTHGHAAAERQIRQDLRQQVADLVVHVVAGQPERVIPEIAAQERCGVIVIGAGSGVGAVGRQVLRRSVCSVLVVKARPRKPYQRLLVGTDFTVESCRGLETAATWFAGAELALMHVLDIPYRSMLLQAGRPDTLSRLERDTMEEFLATARLSAAVRQRLQCHIEYGYPEILLRDHAMASNADLLVIGALRRGRAFHALVGSNASRIVQTAPGDVLVVRDGGAA